VRPPDDSQAKVIRLLLLLTKMMIAASTIAASWVMWLVVVTGVGLWLMRLACPGERVTGSQLPAAFWLGMCLVIGFLQLWHLLLPVDAVTMVLVVLAGLGGIAAMRSQLSFEWPPVKVLAPVALLLLYLGHQASAVGNQYDTGLYHAQVVEWANQYAAVPGLANLHGRLAFNNVSLLFASLVDSGPWQGGGEHVSNGVFILGLGWLAVTSIANRRTRGVVALAVVLLTPLSLMAFHADLRSFSTDAVTVAVILSTLLTIYLLVSDLENPSETRLRALCAASMCVLMVAVKLSALGFSLPALAVVAYVARARLNPRLVGLFALLVLLLGGGYAARGVVMSGYPLYPSTAISAPVQWRAPVEQAKAEAAWVRHTARHPKYEVEPVPWLRNWLVGLWRPFARLRLLLPLAIGVIAFAMALAIGGNPGAAFWWPAVPTIAGAVFWFYMAPSPRFGSAFAWCVAGLSVASLAQAAGFRLYRALIGALVVLTIAPVADPIFRALARGESPDQLGRLLLGIMVVAPPKQGYWHPMPESITESYSTSSGLILRVPLKGDPCWRSELPCTPHPAPNLRLREREDLGGGFVVEGQWDPEIFPAKGVPFLAVWRCRTAGICPSPPVD